MFVNVGCDRSYNFNFFSLLIWAIIFNFKLNMEQSSRNENTYEVRMEDEHLQEFEKNASVQKKKK
jgi:hypothetical protein